MTTRKNVTDLYLRARLTGQLPHQQYGSWAWLKHEIRKNFRECIEEFRMVRERLTNR